MVQQITKTKQVKTKYSFSDFFFCNSGLSLFVLSNVPVLSLCLLEKTDTNGNMKVKASLAPASSCRMEFIHRNFHNEQEFCKMAGSGFEKKTTACKPRNWSQLHDRFARARIRCNISWPWNTLKPPKTEIYNLSFLLRKLSHGKVTKVGMRVAVCDTIHMEWLALLADLQCLVTCLRANFKVNVRQYGHMSFKLVTETHTHTPLMRKNLLEQFWIRKIGDHGCIVDYLTHRYGLCDSTSKHPSYITSQSSCPKQAVVVSHMCDRFLAQSTDEIWWSQVWWDKS